jgi:hypothetical protein
MREGLFWLEGEEGQRENRDDRASEQLEDG